MSHTNEPTKIDGISGTEGKTAAENQIDGTIKPIKEDIWKFFDADAFKTLENTRIVGVSQLISENTEAQSMGLFAGGENHAVFKAYNYFRRAVEGDPSVKPRAPITVKDNGDGTFTILDGLATTSAAKILGWKLLPVQITSF
jgi:hypothetical protein